MTNIVKTISLVLLSTAVLFCGALYLIYLDGSRYNYADENFIAKLSKSTDNNDLLYSAILDKNFDNKINLIEKVINDDTNNTLAKLFLVKVCKRNQGNSRCDLDSSTFDLLESDPMNSAFISLRAEHLLHQKKSTEALNLIKKIDSSYHYEDYYFKVFELAENTIDEHRSLPFKALAAVIESKYVKTMGVVSREFLPPNISACSSRKNEDYGTSLEWVNACFALGTSMVSSLNTLNKGTGQSYQKMAQSTKQEFFNSSFPNFNPDKANYSKSVQNHHALSKHLQLSFLFAWNQDRYFDNFKQKGELDAMEILAQEE